MYFPEGLRKIQALSRSLFRLNRWQGRDFKVVGGQDYEFGIILRTACILNERTGIVVFIIVMIMIVDGK